VNDSAVSIEIQSLRDEIESLRRGVNSDSPNSNSGDGDGYTPGDQEYDVLSGFSKNSVEKSGPGKRGGAPPPSMHVTGNDMLLAEDTNLPSWRENQQVQEELRSPKFIPAPAVNDGAPAFKMADACQAHVPTYNSMDVEELRELMQVRHLPVGMGDKPEMVAQLRDDDSKSPSVRASDRARRKREMRERSREPKPSARREAKPRRRSSDGCLHTPRKVTVDETYNSAPVGIAHNRIPPMRSSLPGTIAEDSGDELTPPSSPSSVRGTSPQNEGDAAAISPAPASINWN